MTRLYSCSISKCLMNHEGSCFRDYVLAEEIECECSAESKEDLVSVEINKSLKELLTQND